ncbi:hypothetical protein FRX31_027054 [Thalictrum thalictroides]|uniref:F-box associated beta-propeller type 3 domain-containing protein n=1 Tax=Thalictrum thalictroides TaxID=46969 RepID=A0A7J6VE45_THATH|nr:hypothetical protein FRX31_027054 [Thalictrum thalictroides]
MDMIALFMRWVHIIWGYAFRLFGQTRAPDLPSDIILDIFSRLPAELVVQCRDGCRMIFTLTTSSSFIEMHLNRASSIIVFQYASRCAIFNEQKGVFESVISLCFVDEENKKITKKRLESCLKSSESILSFDMDSENIRTIARPTVKYDQPTECFSMHLLKKEGFLWFCDVTSYTYMDIWILVDYESEVWIKLQRISLDFLSLSDWKGTKYILKSIQLDKDELIVRWENRLFRYNLQQNVAKKVEMRGIEELLDYYLLLHTDSLVSLHNDTNSPCVIICKLD